MLIVLINNYCFTQLFIFLPSVHCSLQFMFYAATVAFFHVRNLSSLSAYICTARTATHIQAGYKIPHQCVRKNRCRKKSNKLTFHCKIQSSPIRPNLISTIVKCHFVFATVYFVSVLYIWPAQVHFLILNAVIR